MKKILITLLVMLTLTLPVRAFDIPEYQLNSIYCQDFASILSNDTEAYIMEKGSLLESKCKSQIVVVTLNDVIDDIKEYALEMFNTYGIGDKNLNNGLLLLVADNDYIITSGKGIDSYFNSTVLSTVLDTYFKEYYQNKEYDRAVVSTYDALFNEMSNYYRIDYSDQTSEETVKPFRITDHLVSLIALILGLIVALVTFILVRMKKITDDSKDFVKKGNTNRKDRYLYRRRYRSNNSSSYQKRSSYTNSSSTRTYSSYGGGRSRGTSSKGKR